ncbi:Regulator of nonsense transcripts 1 [Thelohanellus kitauei]|uniref:Regulator of nonsense transcripts 1 n=1 Tax=Thelohanellus kitauei TaxID=669202 RepID=A0A0C2JIM0_THEKT|nr:Regulator of nonsense transcripts 1 [Thelohanellus kitauei]
MHPALSEFSSLAFYQGSIKNGVTIDDRTDQNITFEWPVKDKPTFFYSSYGSERSSSSGTSFFNQHEVKAVKMFVKNLIDAGVDGTQIGIITPYDGQRSRIVDAIAKRNKKRVRRNRYSGIEVANVHPFQGREKDYIIISCVRSNYKNNIGFMKDSRILNVALTRARFGLIIVGNPCVLSQNILWKTLLAYYDKNNLIFESPSEDLKLPHLLANRMIKRSNSRKKKEAQSNTTPGFDQIDCVTNTCKKKKESVNTVSPLQEDLILSNVQSKSNLITDKLIQSVSGEKHGPDHSNLRPICKDWDQQNMDPSSGSLLHKPMSLDDDLIEKCSDKAINNKEVEILDKSNIILLGYK